MIAITIGKSHLSDDTTLSESIELELATQQSQVLWNRLYSEQPVLYDRLDLI